MSNINLGSIVTVDLENKNASNTFIVKSLLNDEEVLLEHPLCPDIYFIYNKDRINISSPRIKDSTEKCLDFANDNSANLGFNMRSDLESLCMYFVTKRQLTPKQKSTLSQICGTLATIHFNDNLNDAMSYITKNNAVLDDFNRMWYDNFKGLFMKKQHITSKKQRAAIFNMAGFVLAELTNPKAPK